MRELVCHLRGWTNDPAMFLLTLLTLIILAFYTYYTRRLVLDGEANSAEQAALTQESNRISRESFSSVQRAFITITDVNISRGNPERYPEGIPRSEFWMILPVIENSGNTPTKRLRWMNALSMTVGPEQDPDKLAVDIGKNASSDPSPWNYGVLGPKAKMTLDYGGNRVFLKDAAISELPDVDRKEGKIMWQGVIRYYDIFPNTPEHVMKFCYFVRADRADANGRIGTPYAIQCGGHTNCADDECQQETVSNGK